MVPPVQIPCHITVLYIFAVINLMALFHITLVDATVIVKNFNVTIAEMSDLPAKFGPELTPEGIMGHLMYVSPTDACTPVNHSPPAVAGIHWIALIKRGPAHRSDCSFDHKVIMAQKAGYVGAIVHNVNSEDLVSMGSSPEHPTVIIPSVFIGERDGHYLAKKNYSRSVLVVLNSRSSPFDVDSALKYMIPFVVVVGISFLVTVAVAIGKWVRDYRRRRRSRLSKEHLKKLPVKKFKKGDPYDVCAICLDEYEEGHKLRILPCSHAYHMKCVDPWLLNNKRVCPVCKRHVIPGDESSDSDSDYDDEEDNANEATPLLHPGQSSINGNSPRNNFDNSGIPHSMRGEVTVADSDSDDSVEPFPQSLASLAEIHTPVLSQGSLHRNPTRSYGALASAQVISEAGSPSGASAEYGARGGHDNQGLDLVEEYYADVVEDSPVGDSEGQELPSMLDTVQAPDEEDCTSVQVVDSTDVTSHHQDPEA